ncbi:MAG: hypothetical protein KBD53_09670 [Candidatus Omnitrophica bacterium]|nr:hypothetical protein [Candidatus Omnitrophota bacterium]
MGLIQGFLLSSFGLFFICVFVLAIAWAVHIRRWDQLLLTCGLTGAAFGILIAKTTEITANSVFPAAVLLIGAVMGMLFGLIYGSFSLSVLYWIRRFNKPSH